MITQCTSVKDAKHNHEGNGGEGEDIGNGDQFVTDEAIAKVMALGFDHHQAVDAIIKAKGDVGEASMMLSCDQVTYCSHSDVVVMVIAMILHSKMTMMIL